MTVRPTLRLTRPTREPMARSLPFTLVHFGALFLPGILLALVGLHCSGSTRLWFLVGAVGGFALSAILYRVGDPRPWHDLLPVIPSAVALVWHWFGKVDFADPLHRIIQSIFVIMAVSLFAGQTLVAGGGPALRRSRWLAARLAARRKWPEQLNDCRTVPEVDTLRDSIADDAAPALPLLQHDSPQVQIAALAALEFRKTWQYGQPEQVLSLAQSAPYPEVRAAAILALAHCQQRLLIEALADSLRDPCPPVRQAAVEALLWDTEYRWIWIRHAVHDALADPRFSKDGGLTVSRGKFSAPAIVDLVAWSSESGVLGTRATQTLALHYSSQMLANPTQQLVKQLRDLVVSPRATTIMRLELANILIEQGQMTEELLQQLLNPANPSPLRLLAVESLLVANQLEQAVDVLREVARQPNRELALAAATLVQKYLHVDLGLALGQPPPPIHSRQAADVTRRIMDWANHVVPSVPVGQANSLEW